MEYNTKEVIWMNYKAGEDAEKNIVVSINGKETNRIPLKDAIKRKRSIEDIVMKEIEKSPEIKAVAEFFVHINGKKIKPKDVKNVRIENVKTIEIFDKVPEGSIEK
jgi:C-terminal processing protease CtpA/Prc